MRATGAALHHSGPHVVCIQNSFWPLVLHGCPLAVRGFVLTCAHWRSPYIAALRMSTTGRCIVYRQRGFGHSTCTRGSWRRSFVVLLFLLFLLFFFSARALLEFGVASLPTNLYFITDSLQFCIMTNNYKHHCKQSLNTQYDSPCNAL
jgi:hypothetical protein